MILVTIVTLFLYYLFSKSIYFQVIYSWSKQKHSFIFSRSVFIESPRYCLAAIARRYIYYGSHPVYWLVSGIFG